MLHFLRSFVSQFLLLNNNVSFKLLGLMLGLQIRDEDEVKERFEVACLLIKNGANINVRNNRGATPLQCGSNQSLRNAVRQFAAKQYADVNPY